MTCQRCMKELPTARFFGDETMVLEHTCTPTTRWLAMETELETAQAFHKVAVQQRDQAWQESADKDAQVTRLQDLLDTIQMACGHVGNGSSTTVKIFQDDATGSWFMQSGESMTAFSERGGFIGAVEEFSKHFMEDEFGELRPALADKQNVEG